MGPLCRARCDFPCMHPRVVAREGRREAMQENARECVALRGKLLQVRFFAQNPSEVFVCDLIRMLGVPACSHRSNSVRVL